MVDRVEVRPDVRVENKVHLFGGDPDHQSIQRIMLTALRSEPVREPEEVFLVDRVPMRSPTDASLSPLRTTAHGSGSMWIATPSSCRTCANYSLPVSPAHCERFCTSSRLWRTRKGGLAHETCSQDPLDAAHSAPILSAAGAMGRRCEARSDAADHPP
jgi:hypothetical protein